MTTGVMWRRPKTIGGDMLQLQGIAEVAWDARGTGGDALAERAWTFTIVRGWLRRAVFGLEELRAG